MIERYERLPSVLRESELAERFHAIAHEVIATEKAQYIAGVFQQVDNKRRVTMPKGGEHPERAPLWLFKAEPCMSRITPREVVEVHFGAFEISGLDADATVTYHPYRDIKQACEKGCGFVSVDMALPQNIRELSPAVVDENHRNREGKDRREAEVTQTRDTLLRVTFDLARTVFKLEEAGEEFSLADGITSAADVNAVFSAQGLPSARDSYENPRSKHSKAPFYMSRTNEMLKHEGEVIADISHAEIVPTLVVRVPGQDQFLATNEVVPPYLHLPPRDPEETMLNQADYGMQEQLFIKNK
jgi:hypothetical protein